MAHPNKTSDRGSAQDVRKATHLSGIVKRMLDDKKAINQFFRGEITINEIDDRGIKFVKPL